MTSPNAGLIRDSYRREDSEPRSRLVGMKPRRHSMLDLHPAAFIGSLVGGDPQEASPVDAEPDTTVPEPPVLGRFSARLRRRRERAAYWARAQSGRLQIS